MPRLDRRPDRASLARAATLAGLAFLPWATAGCGDRPEPPEGPDAPSAPGTVTERVEALCAACHKFPPPESFPRSAWKLQVERGYKFFAESSLSLNAPPEKVTTEWFERRAPERLPDADVHPATTPPPVVFEEVPAWPESVNLNRPPAYTTSNVSLVHLFDDKRLDVLACDMGTPVVRGSGSIKVFRPYRTDARWEVLGKVPHPAHVEVVDLDGDGIKDLLVACLGNFSPSDERCGSVVWLRGRADGTFAPHTLLQGVGRVADVQAARFRGPDRWDLVVGVFGAQKEGAILFLENRTTDWNAPRFERRVLDPRHGTIHVPVLDLDGDGKPDFIALISQEFETVVAFLNEGGGKFREETLFTGPHPAYGSSGILPVDMNGDGRADVLYTNGDTLDPPYVVKPYHGVQWLENPGDGSLPWKRHEVGAMYGVHRAVALKSSRTGLMDVVAVSFLPDMFFPDRRSMALDSVVLFEQTAPDRFERHVLEARTCDHATCVLGDVTGSGRLDLVVGNLGLTTEHTVTVWKNVADRK